MKKINLIFSLCISLICLIGCGGKNQGVFSVTWKNDDRTTIYEDKYNAGELPIYKGALPTKAKDQQFTYTFSGWEPEIAPVTKDVVYTAKYSNQLNKYNIKFVNYDGSLLLSEETEYGKMPIEPSAPTKPSDPEWNYYFSGWSPSLTTCTGDAIYTAQYSTAPQKYNLTVTSDDGNKGTVSGSGTFDFNKSVTISAESINRYEFLGWYLNSSLLSTNNPYTFTMGVGDKKIVGVFINKKYKLTVNNSDSQCGSVIGSGNYSWGSSVTVNALNNEWATFEGWYNNDTLVSSSPTYTFTMPESNYELTAKWVRNKYQLNVISSDENRGSVSGSGNYSWGTKVNISATPLNSHVFSGWYDDELKLISNSSNFEVEIPKNNYSLYARWDNEFIVTLDNDRGISTCSSDKYLASEGETVTITATSTYYNLTNVSYYDGEKTVTVAFVDGKASFTMPNCSVSIKINSTCPKSFANCTWDELAYAAKNGTDYLHYLFKEECEKSSFPGTLIGLQKNVIVNGLTHKTRVIDENHDVDVDGNVCPLTFEFVNVLCDENGHSLASIWSERSEKDYGGDCCYKNSSLRKNLTGEGEAEYKGWFDYNNTSRNIRKDTALEMLPVELSKNIKEVKKKTNYRKSPNVFDQTEFTDKLFIPSAAEFDVEKIGPHQQEEGTPYLFYKDVDVHDSRRMKSEIVTPYTSYINGCDIRDSVFYKKGTNFAGYNYYDIGSIYWGRSIKSAEQYSAFYAAAFVIQKYDGTYKLWYEGYCSFNCALPLAPAFCI